MQKTNWKSVKLHTPLSIYHKGRWIDGTYAGTLGGNQHWANTENGLIKIKSVKIKPCKNNVEVVECNQ